MAIYDYHNPGFEFTNVRDILATSTVSRSRFSDAIKNIDLGRYSAAFEILKNCADPKSNNIKAVLLLRMQQPDAAVNLLRQQVWNLASLTLTNNVPPFVQLNLATAMFVSGNLNGCIEIIRNCSAMNDQQAVELLASIKSWEKSLSLLKWLDWKVCGIAHVKGQIPFTGTPGRFGWESNGSHVKAESETVLESPPRSQGQVLELWSPKASHRPKSTHESEGSL